MNVLYLLKRYAMQAISDRFDQDSSRLMEAHFQGYVLEALEKIKRANKFLQGGGGGGQHYGSHLHLNHHRWVEGNKYLTWSTCNSAFASQAGGNGGKSPLASQPNSAVEEKPPTASILAADQQNLAQNKTPSAWELLKNSVQKRRQRHLKRKAENSGGNGTSGGGAGGGSSRRGSGGSTPGGPNSAATKSRLKGSASPLVSILDTEKDHEDDLQEFVGTRKKTRMIDSLRNKPIEVRKEDVNV